jgi:septal ring factor EnvC (AmiA/AmiB activator)
VTKTTRMRSLAVLVGLLAAGTLGGAPAHAAASFQAPATRDAQDPPAAPNRGNRPDPSDPLAPVSTGELVNMLDTYAIVRAQAELTLSDAQYAQFVTRLKRLQEARRRNQRERNQILQDLRRLTGPLAQAPADETVVRERLKALRDHDERATVEMRKAYETLDEVLDVRQQARFRIFEETIERRKLDLVLRARERANRPGRGSQ